ncbi:MAG TPA: peptide-methionine (S)-S-oxide reductase MsrA [Gemmatimonadales bacterium]|nr:peptide-methionine (S)-S-oxide reductase MsrA [Gemmatimonadales bacterium]
MHPLLAFVLAAATATAPLDTATFAGGCFWSMERAFDQVAGVVSVTVGYTGGQTPHPTYEQVSTGQTGHREAVRVVYDPQRVTYEQLVDAFWHDIDPTQADGQFCDHGDEYRTAIFYGDTAQHRVAAASRRALETRFAQPIATEIIRATAFYPAEEYHQHYYKKNPIRYGMYRVACGRDRRLREVWGLLRAPFLGGAPHVGLGPRRGCPKCSVQPVQLVDESGPAQIVTQVVPTNHLGVGRGALIRHGVLHRDSFVSARRFKEERGPGRTADELDRLDGPHTCEPAFAPVSREAVELS